MKTALILGIGGQDGSYLADILLEKGYNVHGLYRRSSVDNLQRIAHIRDKITLHQGDLLDFNSVANAIEKCNPSEVYNEADQDDITWSHSIPDYNLHVTGGAVGNLLRHLSTTFYYQFQWPVKVFQPLSATMFGNSPAPQNEESKHDPKSPYACAKCFAYHLCRHYRETYGMYVATGIFYNHDSPRRGEGYLLQTICRQAIEVANGIREKILLGNLTQLVNIGHAKEYMQAAHSIMQLDKPNDFVIGTEALFTVANLARYALEYLKIESYGRIEQDPNWKRVEQQTILRADISKARNAFGFKPHFFGLYLVNEIMEGLKKKGIEAYPTVDFKITQRGRIEKLESQARIEENIRLEQSEIDP